MSDNREVAGGILKEAFDTITSKRPGVHGSAENSFQMIAEYWTTRIKHVARVRGYDIDYSFKLTPVDVASMMAMLKDARAVYGDPTNRDNFVDGAGYTALAGMLQLPDETARSTSRPPLGGKTAAEADKDTADRIEQEEAAKLAERLAGHKRTA